MLTAFGPKNAELDRLMLCSSRALFIMFFQPTYLPVSGSSLYTPFLVTLSLRKLDSGSRVLFWKESPVCT